jgi:O-methyltransferase
MTVILPPSPRSKSSGKAKGPAAMTLPVFAGLLIGLLIGRNTSSSNPYVVKDPNTSACTSAILRPDGKIPFEKRVELVCPNKCSNWLSELNKCGDDKVCTCDPKFDGADCSFNKATCTIANVGELMQKVNEHYRKVGGYDGLPQAHTHIILGNEVIQNRVPGDVVELGVFKGGSSSVLVHTFEKCAHKRFWFYDSFAGHPEIDAIKNPGMENWKGKHIGTQEEAKHNIQTMNPEMDEQRIVWRKGFFKDTLKEELPEVIAYLHIDCDWYECHIETLDALYDRVAWGGAVVFDDVGTYGFARAGVMDWIRKRDLIPAMRSTHGVGGLHGGGSQFWIKGYQGYMAGFGTGAQALWPGGKRHTW